MTTLPTFLTVDELAAILRCQPEKVYRLAARGELPSYKVEGRRLFDRRRSLRDGSRGAATAYASRPAALPEEGSDGVDPLLSNR